MPNGRDLARAAALLRLAHKASKEAVKLTRAANAILSRVCVDHCREKGIGTRQFDARIEAYMGDEFKEEEENDGLETG